MYVDDYKLRRFLRGKDKEIGHSKMDAAFAFISAVGFVISAWESSIPFKEVMALIGIAFTIWSIVGIMKAFYHPYNGETMYKEIKSMDQIKHKFSLIAIKDTFREHPTRFLVYWDKNWECFLLLNFRTPEENAEKELARQVSNHLQLPEGDVRLTKKDFRVTEKFSVRDKVDKKYEHTLYLASIETFPDILRSERFTLNGVNFRWMTLMEMKEDPNIMEKNEDVVKTLEEKAA